MRRKTHFTYAAPRWLFFCALASASLLVNVLHADEKIDFDREIRPILSEYCFHCHGPDSKTREADLRLDTHEGVLAEHDGTTAVIPGNSADSEIIIRMLSDDSEKIMPPVKSKRKMKPADIEKIRRWIDEGAEWAEHWAFRPIEKPAVPKLEKNPIDAFLSLKLNKEGLKFSPAAAKPALIRRVSLDLTGIPPTPEEVTEFVHDKSPDAYEKLVDKLLASKHYGERMAWDWLDAARYADTDGFQGDPTRDMWPWRDWLIRSLNNNMPFDQFTIEMLAGDMLPNATTQQKLASAFNRNHSYNNEGGRVPEETRVENVIDRAETTSTVWMGLTMGCARCHDHKYDPISQKEYYQLYSFFNRSSESGQIRRGRAEPLLIYPNHAQQRDLKAIGKERESINLRMEKSHPQFVKALPQIRKEMAKNSQRIKWQTLAPHKLRAQSQLSLIKTVDDSFRTNGRGLESDIYYITSKTSLTSLRSLRLDTLPYDALQPQGKSGDVAGKFVLSNIDVLIRPLTKTDTEFKKIAIVSAEADNNRKGYDVAGAFDHELETTGWAIDVSQWNEPHTAIFNFEKQHKSDTGFEIRVELSFKSERKYHNLSRGRLLVSAETETLEDAPLPWNVVNALRVPKVDRSAIDIKTIADFEQASYFKKESARLKALDKKQKVIFDKSSQVMIMDDLPPKKHRKTTILSGGIYNAPVGGELPTETPKFLPPMDPNVEPNRLNLAKWLVSPEHPLTSRVIVNRYWQSFFGRGLVGTAEDFGTQGDKPTHPKLLDWLSGEFIRSGWDVKGIHRLIVTSRAYMQSSQVTEEAKEKDPRNLLFSYAPRYRMPSWMLRDQALSVSGLLSEQMGGKGVFPYQPEGIWLDATLGKMKYKPDTGDRIYRRSIYIFWRRIVGPTMLFDSAKRQDCEVLATQTNTPLHALTTLNEPMFVESARKMAERVLEQPAEQRISYAFKLTTSREPDAEEKQYIQGRLINFKDGYRKNTTAAMEALSVGNTPRNKKYDVVEAAAWTGICSILLNLDETQNKE